MSASASGRTISRTSILLEYSGLHLGPGGSSGRVFPIGVKAAIKLCFLRFGELQRFRDLGDDGCIA